MVTVATTNPISSPFLNSGLNFSLSCDENFWLLSVLDLLAFPHRDALMCIVDVVDDTFMAVLRLKGIWLFLNARTCTDEPRHFADLPLFIYNLLYTNIFRSALWNVDTVYKEVFILDICNHNFEINIY